MKLNQTVLLIVIVSTLVVSCGTATELEFYDIDNPLCVDSKFVEQKEYSGFIRDTVVTAALIRIPLDSDQAGNNSSARIGHFSRSAFILSRIENEISQFNVNDINAVRFDDDVKLYRINAHFENAQDQPITIATNSTADQITETRFFYVSPYIVEKHDVDGFLAYCRLKDEQTSCEAYYQIGDYDLTIPVTSTDLHDWPSLDKRIRIEIPKVIRKCPNK